MCLDSSQRRSKLCYSMIESSCYPVSVSRSAKLWSSFSSCREHHVPGKYRERPLSSCSLCFFSAFACIICFSGVIRPALHSDLRLVYVLILIIRACRADRSGHHVCSRAYHCLSKSTRNVPCVFRIRIDAPFRISSGDDSYPVEEPEHSLMSRALHIRKIASAVSC